MKKKLHQHKKILDQKKIHEWISLIHSLHHTGVQRDKSNLDSDMDILPNCLALGVGFLFLDWINNGEHIKMPPHNFDRIFYIWIMGQIRHEKLP
jgi:hypothetical protein